MCAQCHMTNKELHVNNHQGEIQIWRCKRPKLIHVGKVIHVISLDGGIVN